MIPWLLFDLNEKLPLIIYVTFYLVVSLSIPSLNNIFTQHHEVETIKNGFLGNLIFCIAAIGITGPLFFFMFSSYNSEKKSITLVSELQGQQQELLKKEGELKNYVAKIEEGREEEKKRTWASLKRLEEIIAEVKKLSFEAAKIGRELDEKVFIIIPSSVHIEYPIEDEDNSEYWQPSGGYSCS